MKTIIKVSLIVLILSSIILMGACAPIGTPALEPSEEAISPFSLDFSKLSPVKDSMGNLYFLGFMSNKGQAPLFHGVITLNLYDKEGTTIVASGQEQFFSILNPGDKLPISFQLSPQPVSSWARYELSSRVYPAELDIHSHTEVVIADYSIEGTEPFLEMQGKVTNTGQSIAYDICIWAAGYDKGGELVTLGKVISGMITQLEPSQSILFEIDMFDGDVSQVETWEFYAKAWSQ